MTPWSASQDYGARDVMGLWCADVAWAAAMCSKKGTELPIALKVPGWVHLRPARPPAANLDINNGCRQLRHISNEHCTVIS
jgi:hypothetical protein